MATTRLQPLEQRSIGWPPLAAAATAFLGALLSAPAHGQAPPAEESATPRERPPIVVAPDRRIPIVPTAQARARFLAGMRSYLSGLQSILTSLSQNDMQGAARTARELGAMSLNDAPLVSRSPFEDEFRDLGKDLRKDLARIADAAAGSGADTKLVMGRLGIALQTCVACHQTFQLNEIFAAPARQRSTEQAVRSGEQPAAAHADARVPVLAPPNARAYLLRSMRLYLEGLQTILVALSQDDWATVSATASAMESVDVLQTPLSAAAGQEVAFRDLALDLQRRFGTIAEHAGARDTAATLGRVGEALGTCVACHRTYRLDDPPRPEPPANRR